MTTPTSNDTKNKIPKKKWLLLKLLAHTVIGLLLTTKKLHNAE